MMHKITCAWAHTLHLPSLVKGKAVRGHLQATPHHAGHRAAVLAHCTLLLTEHVHAILPMEVWWDLKCHPRISSEHGPSTACLLTLASSLALAIPTGLKTTHLFLFSSSKFLASTSKSPKKNTGPGLRPSPAPCTPRPATACRAWPSS